jgi:hypothetical protein
MNITNDMIEAWLGDDYEQEEVLDYLCSLLNREFSLESARKEVLSYSGHQNEVEPSISLTNYKNLNETSPV